MDRVGTHSQSRNSKLNTDIDMYPHVRISGYNIYHSNDTVIISNKCNTKGSPITVLHSNLVANKNDEKINQSYPDSVMRIVKCKHILEKTSLNQLCRKLF